MTVESPPPLGFGLGQPGYEKVKHSGAGSTGSIEYGLMSLVHLWTNGYGKGANHLTGRQVRWHTIKLLRSFLSHKGNPGILVPQNLAGLLTAGRLSDIGIAIGSGLIKTKKNHIDIDWFGPPSPAQKSNWWQPACDGGKAEVDVAWGILHYLEDSLGLDRTDQLPSIKWSWPPALRDKMSRLSPNELLNSVFEAAVDAEVFDNLSGGFDDLYIEWRYGVEGVSAVQCSIKPSGMNPSGLLIETPDVSGPDPN